MNGMLFPLLLVAVAVVQNDKVVVTERNLGPGERIASSHPMLLVFESGLAGQSFFKPGEEFRNSTKAEVRFAEIEFLGAGGEETWGASGLSPNYQVTLENRFARVYDIRIPAGTNEPQHTHHARVVVCLSGAELRHLMPDGRTETSTLRTGEIAWRNGGTHIGQNLGKTDLRVIAIEPK